MLPWFVTLVHADQVPSGIAVLPLRTCTVSDVPAGKLAVQLAVPQVTIRPASKTEEINVPLLWNVPAWAPAANCSSPPAELVTAVPLCVPALKSATLVCTH